MSNIHTAALVSQNAKIGKNVSIGANTIIGENVKIGDNVVIESNVVIDGDTTIGDGTHIFPFSAIGMIPQDLKFKGEKSKLIIGKNNRIRENVTIHVGTSGGGVTTEIKDNCLIMIGCHIAHDCKISNNVIMANNVTLGGHVEIDEFAVLGGKSGVHQFVRIGKHSMLGAMSALEGDVVPYSRVLGNRARLVGLNIVGLKRNDAFGKNDVIELKKVYDFLFFSSNNSTFNERLKDTKGMFPDNKLVKDVINFIKNPSSRSLCLSSKRNSGSEITND